MVWGMFLPERFGEFWPDGDFEGETPDGDEGWGERLRLHYMAQSREEQKQLLDCGTAAEGYGAARYAYYVSQKFIRETGIPSDDIGVPLSAVKPHETPIFFKTVKSYAALGSLIKFNGRILAVDETLRAIIESIEPAVHGFYPIEIRMPRGKVFSKEFYTLQIRQYIDAFDPEHSNQKTRKLRDWAFKRTVFGDAHLWRQRTTRENLTCFSDQLHHAIVSAGLRTPKLDAMKEV